MLRRTSDAIGSNLIATCDELVSLGTTRRAAAGIMIDRIPTMITRHLQGLDSPELLVSYVPHSASLPCGASIAASSLLEATAVAEQHASVRV